MKRGREDRIAFRHSLSDSPGMQARSAKQERFPALTLGLTWARYLVRKVSRFWSGREGAFGILLEAL